MRVVFAVLLMAGCTVGTASTGSTSTGGGDDGLTIDAPTGTPVWLDAALGTDGGAFPNCRMPVTGYGDGHHNTGKNCMDGCHNHGFTVAGTVYTSATNNTGYAGATVTLTDKNNQVIDLVVQANGNFYTKNAVAFPVKVMATSCPYGAPMTADSTTGACNTCHAQAGGSAGQMHLP